MSVRKDHRYLHIKKSGGHLGNQLPFLIWKRPGEGKQCVRGHMGSGCNLASLLQASSYIYNEKWLPAPFQPLGSDFCALQVPPLSPHIICSLMALLQWKKDPLGYRRAHVGTCHQAEDILGTLAMSACSLLQYVLALWGEKTIIRKQLETRTGCLVCAKLCFELFESKDFP